MGKLKRFIAEIKHPYMRCERLGHKEHKVIRRGFCDTWLWEELTGQRWHRSVAVKFRKTETVCSRCGEMLFPPQFTMIHTIQSLSLPSSEMDEFEESGILYIEG